MSRLLNISIEEHDKKWNITVITCKGYAKHEQHNAKFYSNLFAVISFVIFLPTLWLDLGMK